MKKTIQTQSTVEIPILQDLGTGRFYFHFDHGQHQNDDDVTVYTATTLLYDHRPSADEVAEDLGRELNSDQYKSLNYSIK